MKNLIWAAIAAIVSQPRVVDYLIKRAKRTPYSHITSADGKDVYMYRFWLFNPYSEDSGKKTGEGSEKDNRRWKSLPSIRIHHIRREDQDRDLHDHPWNARTIVLRGHYTEELPDRIRLRQVGDTGRLLFGEYHRINQVSHDGVWTLFFTWKHQGTWGFSVNGKKVPWRVYLGLDPAASSAKPFAPLSKKEIEDLTAMLWGAPCADDNLKIAEVYIRAYEAILQTGERPKDPVDGGRFSDVSGVFGEGS